MSKHRHGHHPSELAAPSTAPDPEIFARPEIRIPAASEVQQWLAELDALVASLGSYTEALTPAERQRLLKLRRGGEEHIEPVAKAAARYGLSFPGGPGEIEANLALARTLEPLHWRLQAVAGVVSDTIMRSRSAAWRGTTTAYSMLRRMKRNTPSIATEIERATGFFVRARNASKAPKPPSEPEKEGE